MTERSSGREAGGWRLGGTASQDPDNHRPVPGRCGSAAPCRGPHPFSKASSYLTSSSASSSANAIARAHGSLKARLPAERARRLDEPELGQATGHCERRSADGQRGRAGASGGRGRLTGRRVGDVHGAGGPYLLYLPSSSASRLEALSFASR